MKKRVLFIGLFTSILIASCQSGTKEGMTDDVDLIDTIADPKSGISDSISTPSSSNPNVEKNNYKHPNVSKDAKDQLESQEGQDVNVQYKKDATGGNYKDNSNSSEVVNEKSNTTENVVESGKTSNDGNYKKQNVK